MEGTQGRDMPLLPDDDLDDDSDEEFVMRKMTSAKLAFQREPRLTQEQLFAVTLVYLTNFLDCLGSNISLPTMPFFAKEFHASTVEIGYLFSAYSISTTIALPVLSYLSDKYGRRFVMILSLIGTAVGSFAQGWATSYGVLLAARIFSGIWCGVSSVCQVYVGDLVPPSLRPWYISYLITSSQAALLFGPSIGAGLSVLGLNVPVITNGVMSFALVPIVWYYLPESPEWLKMQAIQRGRFESEQGKSTDGRAVRFESDQGKSADGRVVRIEESEKMKHADSRSKVVRQVRNMEGVGWWGTKWAVAIYGIANFTGMVAQTAFASMYAIYASATFGLDSLHVGFIFTLGAITSVAANIWLSPFIQKKLGDVKAGVFGSLLVLIGALLLAQPVMPVSFVGFLILFQGCAINNSAVSCGASGLTDVQNRSTVMTGVRMFKSLGAVVGPPLAGKVASINVVVPFYVVAFFALAGAVLQLATNRKNNEVRNLVEARKAIAKSNREVWKEYGHWQPEIGTPDEIRDLGEFMADLLTKRNYRWVTYNHELKSLLSDFFPSLSTASPDKMRESYTWMRSRAISFAKKAEQRIAQESGMEL